MITGYFTEVTVPQVAVGEDIKATIGFYAKNPGAYYWKTFLIADCPGLGFRAVLDAAREVGQEARRTKTYTIGEMPDRRIVNSFFLFAHDDAAYDWSWGEYLAWQDGHPVNITHLASRYITLEPAAPLDWVKLTSKTYIISPPVEWVRLTSKGFTITPTVVGWGNLAQRAFVINPKEIPEEPERNLFKDLVVHFKKD